MVDMHSPTGHGLDQMWKHLHYIKMDINYGGSLNNQ